MRHRLIAFALIAAFVLAAPATGRASHHDGCNANAASKVLDVMLVRPVSLVVATASSGLWAGLSPYLALIGVADSWGHAMVVEPWQFTGGRYAGCFSGPDAVAP